MAENVRRASREARRSCPILVDLQGPRSRTARIAVAGAELRVAVGDRVELVAGRLAPDPCPAQLECSLPEAVGQLREGHRIFYDEGRIRLVCERAGPNAALLRVTRVESNGRLRGQKGLNFPDTPLRLEPLTPKDLSDLETVARLADVVGYSFVQSAQDVAHLQQELRRLAPERTLALAAKIETAGGPQPPRDHRAGRRRTAARGHDRPGRPRRRDRLRPPRRDPRRNPLALRGRSRATHVLDTLVRKGNHSRAEITDAAMAERAECVMLNKGPNVLDAVSVLDDVLGRMEAHQSKKTSRLRALRSW
jgi:pyruvate kinase